MNGPQPGAFAAVRLDDPELVEAGDPGGLLRLTAASAAQVRMSLRAVREAGLAPSRPRTILVAASGASAWAGELLAALCGPRSPVQVLVVRGHQLPGWVGASDLVIAVSASGKRPETLALAREATRRGCEFVGVGPERTPLAEIASRARGSFVPVPSGPGRSMLWALAVPTLEVATRLGILRLAEADYEDAAAALEEVSHQCRPSSESFVNPAKSLALDIAGALPMVWGGSPLAAMAAARFASLLSLNAKYPALSGYLPEVSHDQVAILDGPFAPTPTPVFPAAEEFETDLSIDDPFDESAVESGERAGEPRLVLISDEAGEHPAVTRMRTATLTLASERGLLLSELVMEGSEPLRRLASLTQLLDYTSVYLGIACGLDPLASAARGDLREFAERPEGPPPQALGFSLTFQEGVHMRAVIAALVVNLAIAVAKFVAFLVSGSASMLAESVHSLADTGNELLLIIGRGRSRRTRTMEHQFGYGRERYFYSFVVAVMLFTVGAAFSVYDGVKKILEPGQMESPVIAFVVLGVSFVLEGFSLRTAIAEANEMRNGESWTEFVHWTKSAELPVVLMEDLAALLGLGFAFLGVLLAELTGNAAWDGAGSVAVGLLLGCAAFIVGFESKSLLIGESASKTDTAAIVAAIEDGEEGFGLIHLRTTHVSPESLLIAAKVAVEPDMRAADIVARINATEKRIREALPIAETIYLEPDTFRPDEEDHTDPSVAVVRQSRRVSALRSLRAPRRRSGLESD